MTEPFTITDAETWTMREVAHYNGGEKWFGYGHQCIEQPRLYRLDRYQRKDGSVVSTWSVDGVDCADFAHAVERLNAEPLVSADELIMLSALSPDFLPLREVRASEPYTSLPEASSILHHWLPRKGLTWAENGRVRLTELGSRFAGEARV